MSEVIQEKLYYSRITITIPKYLESRLREYQANQLLEDAQYASFSKIVTKLLTESLDAEYKKPLIANSIAKLLTSEQ